ncbi:hypothetical protein [Azohydromonas australica]|uniref:hypothetical protein n=1 Tax=Azohydromonas australica TaxID=364039 RepID=UPI0012EC3FAD|nr:hypothetical protein [Azohydromonas australica]
MKQAALFLAASVPALAHSQASLLPEAWLPVEVQPFVEAGTTPIALRSADLNGDGQLDYILVLEKQTSEDQESDWEEGQRPFLLIVREPSQKLRLAKRNDRIIRCSTCGSDMHDPLEAIEADFEGFSVRQRGWDGSSTFRFEYSRLNDTWQLTRSEQVKLHAKNLHRARGHIVYVTPTHFGTVGIADFDPDAYLNAEFE